MKRIFLLLLVLCFMQQAAWAQAEKEKPAKRDDPDKKDFILRDDFTGRMLEVLAEQRKKEFLAFLNQEAEFARIRDVKSINKAKSAPGDEAAIETDKTEESEKKAERIKHKYEAHFNYSTEALTGGYGIWQSASLYFQRRSADKKILWGQYRVSQRRSFRDQEVIGGIYKPFGKNWAFTAEGMYSPTKKFVGGFSAMGEIEKVFKGGWVGHLGVRYTSYTTVKATTSYALVEKYWGNNRLANTLYITNLSNAGTAPSYRLQYNRYYGERINSFGAAVSFGREHENIGPPVGIFRANTWSLSGSLRHWINDNFGISADVLIHRQGDLYYRRGLNFGVRYRF